MTGSQSDKSAENAERVARAGELLGRRAQRAVPIGPMTTYRVGGAAALFCRAEGPDDLLAIAEAVTQTGIDVLVVGNGSNMLVADSGFPGLAVVLGDTFGAIEVDRTAVRAGAATSLPVVARRTASLGLTGFEWAVGVPGSIGGAVRMNAGGHGSDMSASLVRVRVIDLSTGEDEEVESSALDLGYRRSNIAPQHLVVRADLALSFGDRATSETEIAEIVRWRRGHQPGGPNAGSVFTNPPGDSAGRLIEAAELKGLRLGTAVVSAKHANFIQADENGSADDVYALMDEVRRRVAVTHGIVLQTETVLVGFDRAHEIPHHDPGSA